MTKIKVRCWKESIRCKTGEMADIFFTFADFYPAQKLFICPTCGEIFAIDPDTEHYQKKDFHQLKNELNCPVCNHSISETLPYPDNFRCLSTGEIERSFRTSGDIPSDQTEIIKEFWNPLS